MLNTLKTWKDSGLLDMVYERIAILNEASVMEVCFYHYCLSGEQALRV